MSFKNFLTGISLLSVAACTPGEPADTSNSTSVRPEALAHYSKRPITDDVMYFVMPDRFYNADPSNDTGGITGDRLDHGFDPTHKGFYHGGDIKGITAKLDYLADMGVSAIWMTPIFKNNPVQGKGENVTSAYHGYWITDFTQVDPHLGTNDDLKELVAEAHKRNMKVIFDIITNHTADIIRYRECNSEGGHFDECEYRAKADYPFNNRASDGAAINAGFLGDGVAHQTEENFAKLTDFNFAYTPYVPEEHENVKVPAWLNSLEYYHNRGNTHWEGESNIYGDFAGLDDVNTEHPRVKAGMIEIYKNWISEFKIDGYRIDTVKHVNDSFWQELSPALSEHASAEGIDNFYMFGEVYNFETEELAHYIHVSKLPAVLDFGFQRAAQNYIADGNGAKAAADYFAKDHLYATNTTDAGYLPTFLGNHDMGRFAHFLDNAYPDANEATHLARLKLANAFMMLGRGVPVIYYGDEQGFIGDGHDQDAREDMFKSAVASYADNNVIGTDKSSADDNFDADHPLYQQIQKLVKIKRSYPALNGGAQSVVHADDESGILILQRTDKASGESVLVAFNSAAETKSAPLPANALSFDICACADDQTQINKSINEQSISLPAFGWAVISAGNCGDKISGTKE